MVHMVCVQPLCIYLDNVIFGYLYGLNNVICMYYLQSSCVNHPQPSSNVTQQPIYLIACHALPRDIQCHISCVIIVLKVPKCLFIGGSAQIFIKIMEISNRNPKNNFHATFMTLKNRNKNDIGQVSGDPPILHMNSRFSWKN